MSENASIETLGGIFRDNQIFALMSHVRPDGDAIGSQLGLGLALEAMGKTVHYWNEDGLPENLEFLPHSEKIARPPHEAPEGLHQGLGSHPHAPRSRQCHAPAWVWPHPLFPPPRRLCHPPLPEADSEDAIPPSAAVGGGSVPD
jgi:hypothetical protein